MKRDVAEFVARSLTCQQVKADRQRPQGFLQSLPMPEWKWEHITIDFITGLPRTPKGVDALWVIMDRLTKIAYFIPIKVTYSIDKLARLHIDNMVHLHRVPVSIISDRDPSYQATIRIAPFEAQYGKKCHTPLYWDKVGERCILGLELIQASYEKVDLIHKRIKATQSRQKAYADQRHKDLEFLIGDKQEGQAKLEIYWAYEILTKIGSVAYRLAFPPSLDDVLNVFYVSMLQNKVVNLRNRPIHYVKVKWCNHTEEEASWEVEVEMRAKYPSLGFLQDSTVVYAGSYNGSDFKVIFGRLNGNSG
ncbi:uncharacterized protein LOC122672311 [Telopea speciosissima]|uniref:uncharacterized protein LOC122672311 n=1 Tax=Telopea speciosissima TaxID=54955 RepID=UPI001CC569AA|nr:uncharacterized protein LOC122672311 [Telopea speciosissima]